MLLNLFKKDELKYLWPFYLEILISALLYIYPVFSVVYFMNINLSLLQIGLLVSISALVSVLFEIPTGAVADIFGRKVSTIIGVFFSAIILLVPFTKNFYLLLLIYAFMGFFKTFISGAFDAWIIDNLKHHKKSELVQEFFVKRESAFHIITIASGLLGAFVVKYFGLNVIWFFGGIAALASTGILLFIPEHGKVRKAHEQNLKGVYTQSFKSIKYAMSHSVILTLLIIFVILTIAIQFNAWAPLLKSVNMPDHYWGYIWSLHGILGAIAPFIAQRIAKKTGSSILLSVSTLLQGLVIMSAFLIVGWPAGVLLFTIYAAFYDGGYPIFEALFQKNLPSRMRATISSFMGLISSVSIIIVAPLVGFMIDTLGPRIVALTSGIIFVFAAVLYFRLKFRKPNAEAQ